jgi:peptidoglycan-associated lipoprotein
MRHPLRVTAALATLALLGGCSSISGLFDRSQTPVETARPTVVVPPPVLTPRPPVATAGAAMLGASPATALPAPAGDSRVVSVSPPPPAAPRDDAAALPPGAARTVYFDFDSAALRDDARPAIEAHARALGADRTRRLVLEGHTDERGGREYNLSLGQKRAETVQQALVRLGASDAQLEAVSFGKERPAAVGTGEEAWARNRRVELKDRR